MPIEGSLREFALHDIFQLLHLSRKTGELSVTKEPTGESGRVLFDSGAVVGARTDDSGARLGDLLLNAGKITEADLRRAESVQASEPERTWGEIFSSLEIVGREEIEKFEKFQVEETIYDMLEWADGQFSFGERPLSESEAVTWIPTESLLMEGARRADEFSALPAIDSKNAVPRLSDEAVNGGVLDLSPEEWEVLGRVDGNSDVRSIAWALGKSEFEVSKLVSRLAQQGLLEIGSQESGGRAKPPHEVALEQAEREIEEGRAAAARTSIEEILVEHPEEPRAHFLIARIEERAGNLSEAVRGYEAVLGLDPLAEEARLRLGLVRLRMGDLSGATREWTAYLRMAQDTPERRRVERAVGAAHELELVLNEFDGREAT